MDSNSKMDYSDLEEGEVDFDASFDEIYTPLERPNRDPAVPSESIADSDIDDDNSSSTDSDSSCNGSNVPKLKKCSKINKLNLDQQKKNKLKIWCNVLEAESVSNNLTDCNLDESQMRIRGLLPYTRRYNPDSFQEDENPNPGKRSYTGQFINRKSYKECKLNFKKGAPKFIDPLPDQMWDSDELLAKEIAIKLNEVKVDLILKAIEIAGREKVIGVFEETRDIEKSGGMLVMNGSRRRTSGGVFFYLLKTSTEIPQEHLKQILHTDKKDAAALKKKNARPIEYEVEMANDDADNNIT